MASNKLWFLGQPAPPNYVAGLGRGATGFTTRSDIGPARAVESGPPEERNAYLAGKPKRDAEADAEAEEEHEREVTGRNVDEGAMFAGLPYDEEDEEADSVWDAIDRRMDSRRKRRREELLQRELEEYRKSRPKIQQKFADLKPELANITYDEWNSIPDIGDYSLRYKAKQQTFTPAPDTLLERARQENQYAAVLDEQQQRFGGGLQSTLGGGGGGGSGAGGLDGSSTSMLNPVNQDLTLMGEARKTMLNLHLQSKADSVTGQTVVDPKGYLTDLNSRKMTSEVEVGDMKRALLLLQSVVTTNPKHAPGWIAIARLHELGGKLVSARKLILKACDNCADSEDVWLEAARLHPPDMARSILARAVKRAPKSVAIWMQAAALSDDTESRRLILRKALEFVPNSVRLWRAAVELESADEARVLLQRAVQCVPTSVEMWLALARLETYDNARAVLNQARVAIPTEPSIWITAAKLEEANGNLPLVDKLISRAMRELAKNGVVLKREDWLREAELAEQSRAPETCAAIVRHSIALGLEDEDRKDTWIDDARHCIERHSIQTARAIYATALTVYPGKKRLWLLNAELEKAHGTAESLEQLLKKAVRYCPQAEILWLMGAKEKWLAGDVDGARLILKEAFKANPNSEQIWLAAVKLENENNQPVRARALLARAREKAGTQRVWMKSAKLERELGDAEQERQLLDEALRLFPDYDKLWLMRAQWDERHAAAAVAAAAAAAGGTAISKADEAAKYNDARQRYKQALKQCPNSLALWCSASRLEERLGAAATARSMLEKARLRNPKSPELWLEAIRVEMRDDKPKMAHALLARALQDCPTAGILWAEAIELEPLAKQKTRAVDALKKCDNDVYVMTAVAKVFWRSRRIDKARGWFNRAVTVDPDIGDAWALFYKFELQHGTAEQQQEVITRCKDSEPCHGEKWCSVSKALGNEHLSVEQILKKVAVIV